MLNYAEKKKEHEKIALQHFSKHEALFSFAGNPNVPGQCFKTLTWKEPGTGISSMYAIIHGNYLMIYGDLGDAVYQFSSNVSFAGIAGCEIDYFASKCRASEVGYGGMAFDSQTVVEHMKCIEKDAIENKKNGDNYLTPTVKALKDSCWQNNIDSEFEWQSFLSNEGDDLFGDDWWESAPDGKKIILRVWLHLIGIQMAVKQS